MLLLSLLPILLILFLMLALRWGAAQAGAAGYLSALAIALLFFGAGPKLLAYAHVRALLLSLDVLVIIWAAFLFYRVADEAGAVRVISQSLPYLTADRGMQALIIGWTFAAFLQGVGGFGVPVAVVSPILVSLGFTPLAAVVIPSIGHGWSVTFGSLGSSFQALISTTGLSAEELTPFSAFFLSVAGVVMGWMVAHAAGGWQAVRRLFWPVAILGGVMGVVHYLVAEAGLWNIASFCAGMAGLVVGFPLARYFRNPTPYPSPTPLPPRSLTPLLLALSGYVILVALTLAVQLIPVVKDFLGQVYVQMHFPQVSTALGYVTPEGVSRKIRIFNHAGTTLVYASLLSYLLYRLAGWYQPGSVGRIVSGTLQRVLSSSLSIASMVAMAVIMENSGMTDALARGLAAGVGMYFPFVSPWIGALGSFMTGSNTNANVMFGVLQLQTANLLKYSAALILAAQTSGASLASVLAPSKVAVGASTAGMSGREGEVMRKLVIYVGLSVLLIGLMTVIGIWISG
jgi:lactate permease